MYIIRVDYIENDPSSYKGIYVWDADTETEVIRFNDGLGKWHFLVDWTRLTSWAREQRPYPLAVSGTLHDYALLVGVGLNL